MPITPSPRREPLRTVALILLLVLGGPAAQATPAVAATATPAAAEPAAAEVDVRLMNVGKAQLESGDYAAAAATFRKVLQGSGPNGPATRNLARALYFNGDYTSAIEVLEKAGTDRSRPASTSYLLGLACLHLGKPADAIPHLERAVHADPEAAALRYQLAKAYEADNRAPEAAAQYRETIRLDPLHPEARFELANYAQAHGDVATYRQEMDAYEQLRDAQGTRERSPLMLEACLHTYAEATERESADAAAAPASDTKIVFKAVTAALLDRAPIVATAVLEQDSEGRYTLIALRQDGSLVLLAPGPEGRLEQSGAPFSVEPVGAHARLRVAHFHDSSNRQLRQAAPGRTFAGFAIVGEKGLRLIERTGASTFADVTSKAGMTGPGGSDACWVDYDADGDLDLLVAGASSLQLWQNGGDGHFTEVGAERGLHTEGAPVLALAVADLDRRRGTDIVAARSPSPTLRYENTGTGSFAASAKLSGSWGPAHGVLVDDLDNDGAHDVVLLSDGAIEVRFGKSFGTCTLECTGWSPDTATLIDFDNDGWLDLCATGPESGGARLRFWRNLGGGHFSEVTHALGSGLAAPSTGTARLVQLLAADLDGDGDSDLLAINDQGGIERWENDGGNRAPQLKVRLETLAEQNHGGLGASVEIRAGKRLRHRLVAQELPIEIGAGALGEIDSVQVVWPDGTVDNRLAVKASATPLLVRRDRAPPTGSCPYLYAWDGYAFRFITDFLGSGAVGLALDRQTVWPSDPDELVAIGGAGALQPRNGVYSLIVGSELREADYFDALSLVAVDHAPDTEVHPTDSFMAPPVTPSSLRAGTIAVPLKAATDGDGRDVTALLRDIDGHYTTAGDVLPPPLHGVCRPVSYTLDFGPLAEDRPLLLALTGHLQFGSASSDIALSQTTGASLAWPALEAGDAAGNWSKVAVNIGVPDGRMKTWVCDLAGKLPAGTQRLRLTTSFQIYWDRLALLLPSELPASRIHERRFERASLGWRGFSEMRTAPDPVSRTPDFQRVADQPAWRTTVEGWCTRYGDVLPLLEARDGQLAILNGGDALTLECDASHFPPLPAGMVRTFFLRAVGWDKEDNTNTVEGESIDPLPGQTPTLTADRDWRRTYSTRWVARRQFDVPAKSLQYP
jgi:tetratricopeptide (TPR) repeat protein